MLQPDEDELESALVVLDWLHDASDLADRPQVASVRDLLARKIAELEEAEDERLGS